MENKNERSKNIIIILLIITIIGLAGLISYDRFVAKNESNKPTSAETKKEENTNTTDSSNNNNTITNTEDNNSMKELDLSKSINTTGVTYSNPSEKVGDYGLSMTINNDNKSITLSIDWKKFCSIAGKTACSQSVEKYQIIGFAKSIKSTFIGDIGQDAKGITLLFLMNDGTVEYMPMFSSIYEINYTYDKTSDGRTTGEHFESKGLIKDVNNVIKLYNVQASNGTGWSTAIGVKSDGSFYDLGHAIKK